jgi:hypothetical protein
MTDNMLREIQEATEKAKAQAAKQLAQVQATQAPAAAAAAAAAPAPVVQQPAPPPALPESANWGAIEDIDADDLLVPKILHQQALSKFAADGLSRPGDFCDSFTGEVLAAKDSKLEVIIFGSFKTMLISKFDQAKRDYVYERTIPITKQNAYELSKKPYYEDIGGESYKNSKQYNFYCLIPSKIQDLPFVITFAGKKCKTAQKINTMIALLNQHNRPGAGVVFELKSISEKNDSGAWFGLEVKQGRDTTPEELKIAHQWYLKSRTTKIVAADEHAVVSEEDVPF